MVRTARPATMVGSVFDLGLVSLCARQSSRSSYTDPFLMISPPNSVTMGAPKFNGVNAPSHSTIQWSFATGVMM